MARKLKAKSVKQKERIIQEFCGQIRQRLKTLGNPMDRCDKLDDVFHQVRERLIIEKLCKDDAVEVFDSIAAELANYPRRLISVQPVVFHSKAANYPEANKFQSEEDRSEWIDLTEDHQVLVRNNLIFNVERFFRLRVSEEIEPFSLPDKLAEIKRRLSRPLNNGSFSHEQYRAALLRIEKELESQLEIEKERVENLKALDFAETNDEYDPAKRGLTRQLAMMLLDDLFPSLRNASNMAKAEFLSLLSGWNADGLRIKWSDYRQGNPNSLNEDKVKVMEWKKKLKIS